LCFKSGRRAPSQGRLKVELKKTKTEKNTFTQKFIHILTERRERKRRRGRKRKRGRRRRRGRKRRIGRRKRRMRGRKRRRKGRGGG